LSARQISIIGGSISGLGTALESLYEYIRDKHFTAFESETMTARTVSKIGGSVPGLGTALEILKKDRRKTKPSYRKIKNQALCLRRTLKIF